MGRGRSAGGDRKDVAAGGRRGYQLAVLVLVGSLLAVFLFARNAGEREQELAKADFVAEANQVSELLRQRLLTYELTTRGGVSLFASVDWPSAAQWQDYVDGLRIEQRSLGIRGLGYAAYLVPSELSALQLQLRAAGMGMYHVRPRGVRERYGPVVYLGPKNAANAEAIGEDLYVDPARRAAMDAARDTGNVHLSAPVALLPAAEATDADPDGLLMFAPVYAGGRMPGNLASRRAAMQGWVYVPIDAAELVRQAVAPVQRDALLRIVDAGAGGAPVYVDQAFERMAAVPRALEHAIEFDAYGRRWVLSFTAAPAPLSGLGLSAQQGTLLVGALLSVLLFAVVWALARTQSRAERLADRMSESYRRSELRFRSALEYSAIGKALLDPAGRVVEANPALSGILGVAPEELRGRTFDGWFAADAAGNAPVEAAPEEVVRATRELRRADGEGRHVQLTYAPVPGDIGTGVARLVQVEDVTERLRAEARIRELNRTLESRVAERTRELNQANQELESFAYSVSHDLRAPLRTIEGFGRMLSERYRAAIDDTGRDYLGRIRAATARMDALIDALLTMSRLSRAELRHAPVDLSSLALEIVADLRHAEPEREVAVTVAPGMRANGDPTLIRNLLQNLIGNAWKFTAGRADARIDIGCEPHTGGVAACYVRDNGAGFSQEYASKLFRPFQRLHSQDEFAGHGVGLASVKRVVERHGGEVWAEGVPGQGACFRFTLPDRPPVREAQPGAA